MTNVTLLNKEKLAENIQNFPVIFYKMDKSHKEKDVVENAWRAVVENVDFVESSKEAKTIFDNLKKRYNKKKKTI